MAIESSSTARHRVATSMTDAARTWLDMLDAEQRATAGGPQPSLGSTDEDRRRWFYTPTDHGGLNFHQQGPGQQQAAMRLVATGLSPEGFVTVATIIGLENVLDYDQGFKASFDRARERGRDVGLYYLRVFGEPGGGRPWGWRFGGHHISLNNLVVGGELVSTTPCFLGANPATSALLGGRLNRPLGQVEDLARELVRSLPRDLARRALLEGAAPPDILTGNSSTISPDDPALGDPAEGVAGSDLTPGQREILRALLTTYFDRVPAEASPTSAYDGAALDRVRFSWQGSTEPGAPHYYRLVGPGLLAEWDNTQRDANHAHSVWRDPTSDFGLDVLAAHRSQHH